MQRQRQEERESFQQAQRQYSSLPRYECSHPPSPLAHPPSKITLASALHTRWSERNHKWVVVGVLLSLEATLLHGKQTGKKGVSGDTNVFT